MTDQRSDARRNRERILAAAVEAVAADGTGVGLATVARRAGVGVATVHRHFPSRDLLLECVLARMLDGAVAAGSLVRGGPGPAFFGFLQRILDESRHNGPLCDAVAAGSGWPQVALGGAVRRFEAALGERLRSAQAAGAVRRDVGTAEVTSLLVGCATMAARGGPGGLRMAVLAIDALRVTEPEFRDTCAECGGPVRQPATGRPARYCGATCRQRAHRRRPA